MLRAALLGDREAIGDALAASSAETFQSLSDEGLGPYIFGLARQACASLPEGTEARLKMDYLAQWDRAERMKICLGNLAELLEPGIGVIALKGPIMSQRFFGDALARVSQDIDFLIREEDAPEAEAKLMGAGYIPKTGSAAIRRLSKPYMHHSSFIKDGFAHELHWALRRHPTYRIDYARLWARRERIESDGRAYPTLPAEYELVLQALSMIDDMERGCLKLKSLADIAAIALQMDGHASWDEFFAERERENILRPTAWSLAFTLESLGIAGSLPQLSRKLSGLLERLELRVGATLPAGPIGRKRLGWSLRESSALKNMAWWMRSLPVRILAN